MRAAALSLSLTVSLQKEKELSVSLDFSFFTDGNKCIGVGFVMHVKERGDQQERRAELHRYFPLLLVHLMIP